MPILVYFMTSSVGIESYQVLLHRLPPICLVSLVDLVLCVGPDLAHFLSAAGINASDRVLLWSCICQQMKMVFFIVLLIYSIDVNKFGVASEITWKCFILSLTYFYCFWNGLLFYISSVWYMLFWIISSCLFGEKKEKKGKNNYPNSVCMTVSNRGHLEKQCGCLYDETLQWFPQQSFPLGFLSMRSQELWTVTEPLDSLYSSRSFMWWLKLPGSGAYS